MKSYFCYIHRRSSMTPELRVLTAEEDETLRTELSVMIREWPTFEAVEIYDAADRAILRFAGGRRIIAH